MPPASKDTTITTLPGGTALISLRRLRDSAGTSGHVRDHLPRHQHDGRRVRRPGTVRRADGGQYAVWTPATFDLDAAFTSLSGLDKNGNSGALNGNDACAGSGKPAIPGVAVPTGTYTGQMNPINGNPDNTPKYIGTGARRNGQGLGRHRLGGHQGRRNAAAGLHPADEQLAHRGPVPQLAGHPGKRRLESPRRSTDGKGILIVTGDLTVSGSYRWDRLVLVGGTLTSNGNNSIMGAVITGLNVKIGIDVRQEAVGNGNKTFQYHSCNLARALGSRRLARAGPERLDRHLVELVGATRYT